MNKNYIIEELLMSEKTDEDIKETYSFGLGHTIKLPTITLILK